MKETTKSHILHNIPFRASRKAVRSVDHLLDRHWLFQARLELEVGPTPIPSVHYTWLYGRGLRSDNA